MFEACGLIIIDTDNRAEQNILFSRETLGHDLIDLEKIPVKKN